MHLPLVIVALTFPAVGTAKADPRSYLALVCEQTGVGAEEKAEGQILVSHLLELLERGRSLIHRVLREPMNHAGLGDGDAINGVCLKEVVSDSDCSDHWDKGYGGTINRR